MSITIDGSTNTITSSAAAITVPPFTTVSSTGNATLGDSSTLDTHTLNGKSTVNDIRFAAVSASLPALSFVDACFHLAKDDTDKGAWRKRKGQSWRSEARSAGKYLGGTGYSNATNAVAAGGATGDVYYNTTSSRFEEITAPTTSSVTYRAGKEDYPTNALITAEAARVIIWDLDGAVPSMWMVFINSSSGAGTMLGRSSTVVSSIVAKDSSIVFGHSSGTNLFAAQIIFAADTAYAWVVAGKYAGSGKIADRNTTGVHYLMPVGTGIVNATVNSVAITVLPDAPVDEYGMPVPTIAIGTAGGASCIKNDGTVVNDTTVTANGIYSVQFNSFGDITYNYGSTSRVYLWPYPQVSTSSTLIYNSSSVRPYLSGGVFLNSVSLGGSRLATSSNSGGVNIIVENLADRLSGMVAHILSTYNTGWMVGDIRGAWLANSSTDDRSIKANTLTAVGSVTVGSTLAVNDYSGWSASVYNHRASDADWDTLGTGSVCMMGWLKCTGNSAVESLMGFANAGNTVRCLVTLTAAGLLECIDDGATAAVTTATTSALDNSAWHHFAFVRTSSTSRALYLDGVLITSNTTDAGSITDTGNLPLAIGIAPDLTSTPATTTSLALLRLTATAPTAEQIKHIYATEAQLFVAGNTCLLSNSDTVSALAYDKDTDTYLVGNGTNVDTFNGLKRIASQAHGVTTLTSVANGNGRKLIAGTGAGYTAPERNVSAELLEAQTLPTRTQQYSFTTPAATTTQALPKGWKAQGIAFNTTDSTFLGTYTQSFDGFIWTMAGLTASKAYQINLVEA